MYEMRGRIRYSEVDPQSRLTWTALLDYFQDCSVAHTEDCGLGVDYLAQHHMVWLLTAWQIVACAFPKLDTEVSVRTWPYDFKGLYGYRNFLMEGTDGTLYAYANSIWALMDTEKGRPIKVTKEIADRYGMEEAYPMGSLERKITLPAAWEKGASIKVPQYFIDTNGHMNNEKYVLVAQEYLPADFSAGEVRVEYRKAARCGDVICPRVTVEPDAVTVNLTDEGGVTYAVVKFSR